MYPYEAMFLLDPVKHGEDPEGTDKSIRDLLEKHGAKIVELERWDERKLAYEIAGHRRGVYLLVHMEMPGESLVPLQRDCRLDETILRQMILRLETDIPAHIERCARYAEAMGEGPESRSGRREESTPAPAAAES